MFKQNDIRLWYRGHYEQTDFTRQIGATYQSGVSDYRSITHLLRRKLTLLYFGTQTIKFPFLSTQKEKKKKKAAVLKNRIYIHISKHF